MAVHGAGRTPPHAGGAARPGTTGGGSGMTRQHGQRAHQPGPPLRPRAPLCRPLRQWGLHRPGKGGTRLPRMVSVDSVGLVSEWQSAEQRGCSRSSCVAKWSAGITAFVLGHTELVQHGLFLVKKLHFPVLPEQPSLSYPSHVFYLQAHGVLAPALPRLLPLSSVLGVPRLPGRGIRRGTACASCGAGRGRARTAMGKRGRATAQSMRRRRGGWTGAGKSMRSAALFSIQENQDAYSTEKV